MGEETNKPYGFVYVTTNTVNGKKYIGQKMYRKDYQYYLGSGALISKAIKKYGRENFKREIVAFAESAEELNILETEYIKNCNAVNDEKYYNLSLGGDCGKPALGYHRNQELRDKQRIAMSGDKNYNYGKHFSVETRRKLSESHRGLCTWSKGKIPSEETKKRISESKKGEKNYWFGKKHTEEWKIKKGIKVICITTDKIFNFIKEGADYYGFDSSNLAKHCKGKTKYCGIDLLTGEKLKWMYYEDYIKEVMIIA
jgi:hypothetical protein